MTNTLHPRVPRAAIYCRVSTDGQERDGTSLDTQLESCRNYAREKGYEVLGGYEYSETFTGTALFERPKMSALLEAIRAKSVDVVICHAIDRLTREPKHLGLIQSEAEHRGVVIDSVTEPSDDSDEADLLRSVRGIFSKVEHGKIKERSRRGREARAKSGKPIPGGSPPLGYRWVWAPASSGEGHRETVSGYEIDPDRAGLIQRIFKHLAEGGSATGLAASLNLEGVPTSKGGRLWYHKTLCVIVANPIYKGEAQSLKARYEMTKGKRSRPTTRPLEERVRISVPPLVSPELWERANAQLVHNRTEARRNNSNPEAYLLRSGLAFCGYCGAPLMAAMHDGLPKYRCSSNNKWLHDCPGGGTIVASELDQAVWELVAPIIGNPEVLLYEIDRELASEDTTTDEIHAVDQELRRLTRQRDGATDAILQLAAREAPRKAAEPFLVKLEKFAREELDLLGKREVLETRRAELRDADQLLAQMYDRLQSEFERLDTLSYEERRQLLRSLGVSVRLWKRDHNPRFHVDMAINPVAYASRQEYEDDRWIGETKWLETVPYDVDVGAFRRFVDTTST